MLNIPGGIKRCGGDEMTYLDLLRAYAQNVGSLLEQIKSIPIGKLADYALLVKRIKDSSYYICAGPAMDLAEELETAAKMRDYDFVQENNGDLIETTEYLLHGIKNFLAIYLE